jgi:hypothetical protein
MNPEDDYGYGSGYGSNYEADGYNSAYDGYSENDDKNSGYGNLGYGQPEQKSPYVSGNELNLDIGISPYETDLYKDAYRENIYEENNTDSSYSETSLSPNSRCRSYRPSSKDYGDDDQLVL